MFVPFTPVGKAIEVRAISLKQNAGLPWYEPVDPLAMLALVPARLVLEADLRLLSPLVAEALFGDGVDEWSALAIDGPDSGKLVVLNSRHSETRRRASLMEEIAHLLLGHPPSKLLVSPDGSAVIRSYDKAVETEAYDVGAACLVPYLPLFQRIRYGAVPALELAHHFGVSEALVQYRIRRSGLSAVYRKRCG